MNSPDVREALAAAIRYALPLVEEDIDEAMNIRRVSRDVIEELERHERTLRAALTQSSPAISAEAREKAIKMFWQEIDRQCAIGAGTAETCAETGLFKVRADLDPFGFADAILAAFARETTPPVEGVGAWYPPYRSMDGSGSPEAAGSVGADWFEALANSEFARDPEGLSTETSRVAEDGSVRSLYRGTKLIAAYVLFRDPMNFTVLLRWLFTPPAPEETVRMREALREAFDFLGGVDDASAIRGKILEALTPKEANPDA